VQQGGSKALIPMALDGTNKGTRCAAQALARIGITQVCDLWTSCSVFCYCRIIRTNNIVLNNYPLERKTEFNYEIIIRHNIVVRFWIQKFHTVKQFHFFVQNHTPSSDAYRKKMPIL